VCFVVARGWCDRREPIDPLALGAPVGSVAALGLERQILMVRLEPDRNRIARRAAWTSLDERVTALPDGLRF